MRDRLKEERGAIAVLAALTIVILLAAVAFVIDISRLYHERQVLQNAVDFGALAGAQDLPVQGAPQATIASTIARTVATANAPQVTAANLTIKFQCVVGDRNADGLPDPGDVPFVCGPTGSWTSGWVPKGTSRLIHDCNPFGGDKCNTINLTTSTTIPYYFAPVIGINSGSTGAVNAASCKGACGAAMAPIDVVIVLDRTGSMSAPDVANVKNAALSVLDFYDPVDQWIGLVSLPYGKGAPGSLGSTTGKCMAYGDRRTGSQGNPSPPPTYQQYPTSLGSTLWWNTTGLSQDYKTSTGINPNSNLVREINCLKRADDWVWATSQGGTANGNHTNLGDSLDAARAMLAGPSGRPTVPDVIIFMTDGVANQPSTMQPCGYFNAKATAAKDAGVTIFTIAYGVSSVNCPNNDSVTFRNRPATFNLASAATQISSDDVPGGCGPNENKDGDHYFCTPALADLEPVFRQVAAAAIETAHLID
ncbi:MAG: TadE/TadG family type IV pilus assembly protein [Actinomycetota bacterium]